jgi:hypothetical protein
MALAHFSNILSHNQNWEPIYKALFEITFDLPAVLGRSTEEVTLLLENAKSVTLPVTPNIEKSVQRFKYSTRAYVNLPTQTHIDDVTIAFNLNENDKNAVFVWNILKAWYDLVWNSQTGETHLKKEIVGNIIVNQHNRRGQVIRRVTYRNVQITSISEISLDWNESGIIEDVTATWVCDYWEDLYIDL